MNDLERDLKHLFDAKARGVDASPAAPESVLRRGRRRQIGVVVGGVLTGIALLAVVGGLTFAVVHDGSKPLPAGPGPDAPYGDRTAQIAGFQVHAPAGWTLLDEWAAAATMSTGTETCTATASVTEIAPGATGAQAQDVRSDPSPSCTTEPTTLPVGIPVFQLSSFDPGLMNLACDVDGGGGSGTLPSDGVAVLVTAFPGSPTIGEVRAALDAHCAPTPVIASMDPGLDLTFVTISFEGRDADPALLDAIGASNTILSGNTDPDPSPLSGPAYVVQTLTVDGVTWQLEAGVASDQAAGRSGTALFVVHAGDTDTAVVAPPLGYLQGFQAQGVSTLSVGTVSDAVSSVAAGGTLAHLLAWPPSLAGFEPGPNLLGGHMWWAVTDHAPSPVVTLADGSTVPTQLGVYRPPGALLSDLSGETIAQGFMPVGNDPWRATADSCEGDACLRTSVAGANLAPSNYMSRFTAGMPPNDRGAITVDYDPRGTIVAGTVPDDVQRVEITTSEGPGAVQDSCQRVTTPGFEHVCVVVAVIPPANDLSTYQLTVRFMDADRNELYPAFKDF